METTTFMPVRLTEGREWFDTMASHPVQEEARRIAYETDARIPGWAKDNPIERITKVRITELRYTDAIIP